MRGHRLVATGELLNQLIQWCQFTLVNQIKLLNEEDEMLKASVEVSLLTQLHHLTEMLMVNVRIHAKETLKDGLCD